MVFRLCSVFPTTPPLHHVDLPASRTLSPFKTYVFAENHKFNFCTGHMRQLLALILNGTPLMFCLPNGNTLASCGLTSFKNILAIWDTYFCPISQIPHLRTIYTTTFALNINGAPAYVLPSQRHHPRLMWTFQLREHSRHLRHIFLPKNTNSTFVQDKCDNFCP